jgi:hypothetical protein
MKTVLTTTPPSALATQNMGMLTPLLNPLGIMRAFEKLYAFRALDDNALKDLGLTRHDIASAKLSDFL